MTDRANPALNNVTIVFDLDGTLINTAPDLQASLNHVLETYGYKSVSADVTQTLIGNGAKAMLRAGLSHQDITVKERALDEMFTLFLKYYSENIAVHSQPYKGCIAALDRLSAAGATLAVCTNKTQALADQLLSKLALAPRFASILGADSVKTPKPNGAHILETVKRAGGTPQRAVMIGDSQTDERAAHNGELPFLFVPFGYGPLDESISHEFTVLNDYSELSVQLIKDLLS